MLIDPLDSVEGIMYMGYISKVDISMIMIYVHLIWVCLYKKVPICEDILGIQNIVWLAAWARFTHFATFRLGT